jgi:hypothetical protein
MKRIALIPAVLTAGVALAPLAQADGDAALNAAVKQVYEKRQAQCTPNMPPHFQGIQLMGSGHGKIIDANPHLGGDFDYFHIPAGSPGVPGANYFRVDAADGSIYFIELNFC